MVTVQRCDHFSQMTQMKQAVQERAEQPRIHPLIWVTRLVVRLGSAAVCTWRRVDNAVTAACISWAEKKTIRCAPK